jgi:hypothetical protein
VFNPEPAFTQGSNNTVSWSAVPGATDYEVQRSPDPLFLAPVASSGWIAGTIHGFTGLPDGVLQHYRVRARAGAAEGAWSAVLTSTQDATFPVITVPERATTTRSTVTLRGGASDPAGIQSVTVNGVTAITSDGFAHWTAEVSNLAVGRNAVRVSAQDRAVPPGNVSTVVVDVRRWDDADGDRLPDLWESPRGIDPADDGSGFAKNGPLGDINGNGISNLVEYALGLWAPATNPIGLPAASFETNPEDGQSYLVLRYSRLIGALDFRWSVETSEDLVNWTSGDHVAEELFPAVVNPGSVTETVRVRIKPKVGDPSAATKVARLRITVE